MYTIVGLGNPGGEYEHTRHNTGRRMVELVAENNHIELKEKKKPDLQVGTGDIEGLGVRVVLPDTFMNNSGRAVVPYIKSVSAAKKLLVVYDEIDLPLGTVRVTVGGSGAGHNGIQSIARSIKTKDFIRIRVGVAKPGKKKGSVVAKKPVGEKAVLDHLLGKFTKGEREKLDSSIYTRVELAISTILETGDPVMGMNAVNGLPAE